MPLNAEGGSNALRALKMDALSRTSATLLMCDARGSGRVVGAKHGCVGAQNSRFHIDTAYMLALYVVPHITNAGLMGIERVE